MQPAENEIDKRKSIEAAKDQSLMEAIHERYNAYLLRESEIGEFVFGGHVNCPNCFEVECKCNAAKS